MQRVIILFFLLNYLWKCEIPEASCGSSNCVEVILKLNSWSSSPKTHQPPSRPLSSGVQIRFKFLVRTLWQFDWALNFKVLARWWQCGFNLITTFPSVSPSSKYPEGFQRVFQFLLLSAGAGGDCVFSFTSFFPSFFSSSSLKNSRGNIPRMQPMPTPMALPCTQENGREESHTQAWASYSQVEHSRATRVIWYFDMFTQNKTGIPHPVGKNWHLELQ